MNTLISELFYILHLIVDFLVVFVMGAVYRVHCIYLFLSLQKLVWFHFSHLVMFQTYNIHIYFLWHMWLLQDQNSSDSQTTGLLLTFNIKSLTNPDTFLINFKISWSSKLLFINAFFFVKSNIWFNQVLSLL